MAKTAKSESETTIGALSSEVLERVLGFVESSKDRGNASMVCTAWYKAEAWSRRRVYIGNCYAVSAEILVRRFPKLTSILLKGKPRFSDFNMVPPHWGADLMPWLVVISEKYSFLEELRLKRMVVTDECLRFIARAFPNFKRLWLHSCEGFSTEGLAAIASHCRNLTELDVQENEIDDRGGYWLSCFPDNFNSLEILNFPCLQCEVNFDALERLVARCRSLKSLKLNKNISLEQLQRLLVKAPQLIELGTGSFSEELRQYAELEIGFNNCRQLRRLSLMGEAASRNLHVLHSVCKNLTFLNLSYICIGSMDFTNLVVNCHNLQRLWVLDTVKDKGLEAVSANCKELREIRVFPDTYGHELSGVTEKGIVAISRGCPNLCYILYFCKQMTNAAVISVAQNCPKFTHFRLCIMDPYQPDYLTEEPMDEAFGAVVKTCKNLRRLSVSGWLTDKTFEYIGRYAKQLETLSIAFAGSGDRGMQHLLQGCPKLRKLEIRDSPFGDKALLSGLERYESMRSLWMSACHVTLEGCRLLAQKMPRLNVELIKKDDDEENDENDGDKLYVYRTVAGRRKDAPNFVLQL
uniref:F-box domain-containing protein n=1 Tax=Araucaria cunninghamii TaxID=56994 RepID=A0A0D6QYK5_ARACU